MGDVLVKLEKWSEAASVYHQAIELNPDFCWSYNNLGDVLVKLEKWSEAASAYGRAIELNPDFPWNHYKLADALVKLEDWEGAIAHYKKAIELDPTGLPRADEKLGYALQQQMQLCATEAVNSYKQAIEKNPDDIELYHKALEIQPNDSESVSYTHLTLPTILSV